jgi:hypothetical protein
MVKHVAWVQKSRNTCKTKNTTWFLTLRDKYHCDDDYDYHDHDDGVILRL